FPHGTWSSISVRMPLLNFLPRFFSDANYFLLAVYFYHFAAHPRRLAGFGIDECQVGDVDASFLFNDAPVGVGSTRLRVFLDDISAFHDRPVLVGQYLQDRSLGSFCVTVNYLNHVAFAILDVMCRFLRLSHDL